CTYGSGYLFSRIAYTATLCPLNKSFWNWLIYHIFLFLSIILQKIPDSLKNPLLIFQSGHYPASLVAVLDLYDSDNNPVIVPVTPFRKYTFDSTELRYNKISSVYGKSHIARFIDNHKNMILYVNEKRSRLFLPRELQSLRAALDHLGSGFYEDNIAHWTCSITRLVIEQVSAKCSAFCCFSAEFVQKLKFLNNSTIKIPSSAMPKKPAW
ncbi:MAG: hypothetical protein LBP74_07225, partial [Treponema sp.]|nr:hypothetical protein [Treponema sp.]